MQLATLMEVLGAVDALNMDGGGSTTLVWQNVLANCTEEGANQPGRARGHVTRRSRAAAAPEDRGCRQRPSGKPALPEVSLPAPEDLREDREADTVILRSAELCCFTRPPRPPRPPRLLRRPWRTRGAVLSPGRPLLPRPTAR
ncbi:phosphodiester glycosidase family protein [Streptomyces sp. NPDC127110]|uniref:phosphodiester glycosidase family protein n=1 Tax=Streptomyces sp. NPDC127110 TaxID=3345362 RepID=UPI003635838F